MAIKFNANKVYSDYMAKQPDTAVTVTLEDGDHEWNVRNSGAFLQSELLRFQSEMLQIQKLTSDAEDATSEEQQQVLEIFNSSVNRLVDAFKEQVKSDDGSASKWIDENRNDMQKLAVVLGGLVSAIQTRAGD
uniref:hypothetical protein n=1 Tax=Alloprevotella sp. TaxID=1872471 RepID=UPI003FF06C1A